MVRIDRLGAQIGSQFRTPNLAWGFREDVLKEMIDPNSIECCFIHSSSVNTVTQTLTLFALTLIALTLFDQNAFLALHSDLCLILYPFLFT